MNMRQIIGWIFVALLCTFIAFNLAQTRVWFFGIRIEMPIALVVLFSAILGAGAVLGLSQLQKRRDRKSPSKA
jgi:uncharacterized integral membrane protein